MDQLPQNQGNQEKLAYTIEPFTDKDQDDEDFKRLGLEVSEEIGQEFGEDWGHIRETYIDTGGAFYLAKVKGKIVGCAGILKMNEDEAELKRFRVFPEFRGDIAGGYIGLSLFDECLSFVKRSGF